MGLLAAEQGKETKWEFDITQSLMEMKIYQKKQNLVESISRSGFVGRILENAVLPKYKFCSTCLQSNDQNKLIIITTIICY